MRPALWDGGRLSLRGWRSIRQQRAGEQRTWWRGPRIAEAVAPFQESAVAVAESWIGADIRSAADVGAGADVGGRSAAARLLVVRLAGLVKDPFDFLHVLM